MPLRYDPPSLLPDRLRFGMARVASMLEDVSARLEERFSAREIRIGAIGVVFGAGLVAVLAGILFSTPPDEAETPKSAAASANTSGDVRVVGAETRRDLPCEQQTWPYIDRRCLTVAGDERGDAAKDLTPLTATGPVTPKVQGVKDQDPAATTGAAAQTSEPAERQPQAAQQDVKQVPARPEAVTVTPQAQPPAAVAPPLQQSSTPSIPAKPQAKTERADNAAPPGKKNGPARRAADNTGPPPAAKKNAQARPGESVSYYEERLPNGRVRKVTVIDRRRAAERADSGAESEPSLDDE